MPAASLADRPRHRGADTQFSKSATKWTNGPGVCIYSWLPGELFRMLQTPFNKCGSVAGTGSDAIVGSQMAFFMWRIVERLGLYVDTLLDGFLPLLRHFRHFTSPRYSSRRIQPPVTSYLIYGRCLN